ncbi:MAG TPA: histidine kinase [Chitinophagaceae bacterium]|nr:histidine kinase [Chitinophagaceae bacterium]
MFNCFLNIVLVAARKLNSVWRVFNFSLFIFFCLFCHCQTFDEKDYTRYTVLEGLSDSYVTGITQDELGYIWISTRNGLNRFDGKEMESIYQIPGKEGLITDNLVDIKAVGNRLLIYSAKGAEWIDIKKNRFIKLKVSEGKPALALQNYFFDVLITKNNTCFVSGYTGVYEFDSLGNLIFRYDRHNPDSTDNLYIYPRFGRSVKKINDQLLLHFDLKYNMSIYDINAKTFRSIEEYKNKLPGLYSLSGTMALKGDFGKHKLLFLDFNSWRLIIYDTQKDVVLTQQSLSAWAKAYFNWGTHWVRLNDSTAFIYGQHNGLYKMHIDPVSLHIRYDTIPLMNSTVFSAAFIDKNNRLWLGAHNGLFRYNKKPVNIFSVKHPSAEKAEFNHPIWFYSLFRSPKFLYACTYSTLPFLVLDGNDYTIKKQVSFERLSKKSNQIWQIVPYNKDTLWFGTQDGLIWYEEKNGTFDRVSIPEIDSLIQHRTITLLYKDSKGMLWIQADWGRGFIKYDPEKRTSKRYAITDKNNYMPLRVVNFAAEDKENNLWFAEKGLIRWNRKTDVFDTLITSYYGFNKDNNAITGLSTDEKGNLVFCNENNGVLTYDPVTHQYNQITTVNGLQENAVYQAKSLDNYLWVISHNYLTAINKKNSKAISYSYSDSFPSALFLRAYHDPVKKRLLLGFDNQFAWISDSIDRPQENFIPFYIDAISVGNDTTLLFPEKTIKLKYFENDIRIHYSALNFDDHLLNRYAYRINGKEWVQLGDENSIYFSNLSPGSYDLEVKYYLASDPDNQSIRTLSLIVAAPFWQQRWFMAVAAGLAIAILIFFYRRKISGIRQKASIDKQIAEYEIKALHAQMNPHFIFNCLNSIREMILNNENQQASHYLSKFAQLIRITLNQSSKQFITLESTIDYLERYIEMEKIRNNKFSCTIETDDQLQTDEIMVPPMLIQPFLENAIWHGAVPGKELHIGVHFKKENNRLICFVEDNGQGIDSSLNSKKQLQDHHNPIGIANVKERIHVLNEKYKLNCELSIEDKSKNGNGSGTTVKLYFPLHSTMS